MKPRLSMAWWFVILPALGVLAMVGAWLTWHLPH